VQVFTLLENSAPLSSKYVSLRSTTSPHVFRPTSQAF